jgi:hypothetical protein
MRGAPSRMWAPMTDKDLLSAVQPPGGWFAIVGIKDGAVRQSFVETREEADALIAKHVAANRDVFFGVAKFKTDENRTKENVQSLKAVWLDIDCGPSKAVPNPKTGRPAGYEDQTTAISALRSFCIDLHLPRPTLVNSGRGVHAYWPLTEAVTREEWEPVAARLRELCVEREFYVDPAIFEVARILRVPGTFNHKGDEPLPVEVITYSTPVDLAEFKELLGEPKVPYVAPRTALTKKDGGEVSPLTQMLRDSSDTSFAKIMRRSMSGTGCNQLRDCYENRDTLEEPRWFNALSIAKFCFDRESASLKLSEGHPEFTPERTARKMAGAKGPHSCKEFDLHNPGGCEGCPHWGKITNPLALGRVLAKPKEVEHDPEFEEDEDGEEPAPLPGKYPKPPFPYEWGRDYSVWRGASKDEEEPTLVYEYPIYVLKRMNDPVKRDVVIIHIHMPLDGLKEFTLSNADVMDGNELRKVLASYGVMTTKKRFDLIVDYVMNSVRELQTTQKVEKMRQQMGWTEDDKGFVLGDKEYTTDGIFSSPPSSVTENLAAKMQVKGTLEKWKEVFNLYGRKGLEPHAFAALTAFGAPLFKFTGLSGAAINVVHPESGTGKTTTLLMCNSVYGSPVGLCLTQADTMNAKVQRMGMNNNLPCTFDEITNTTAQEFSDFLYGLTQGRGKDRMKQSVNEMRTNTTTWQTIGLCSSNASFVEKLYSIKTNPSGELMRIFEYKIGPVDAIDAELGRAMFDHQLLDNYGHAGVIYAEFLVNNKDSALATLQGMQERLAKELRVTKSERFWAAEVACNIAGGLIAKELGLLDWDIRAIYAFACKAFLSMREQVTLPPALSDPVSVLAEYMNRNLQNILVVNAEKDPKSNMATLPSREPKGELLIRFEPDVQRLYFTAGAFKTDCVKYQINYRDTLKTLTSMGVFLGTATKRLSSGMKLASAPSHVLVFNTAAQGFMDMRGMAATEDTDAGGES